MDKANLAVSYLIRSKEIFLSNQTGPEYKAIMISLSYDYLLLNNFVDATNTVDELLKHQNPSGDSDACKAYIYNAEGYEAYNKSDSENSVSYLKKAYGLKKWPLFASNLINAYMLACDKTNDNQSKRDFIHKALLIYSVHKDHEYWKDPTKNYLKTGNDLETYAKHYSVTVNDCAPTPTPFSVKSWISNLFSTNNN